MSQLQIFLFGKFRCQIADVPVPGLEVRKAQELLSFLAMHRTRVHHREALAARLWQEQPALRAKKGLRQALWLVHSALSHLAAESASPFILIDGDWIGLNPGIDSWVDASVVEATYTRCQHVPEHALDAGQVDELRHAVALCQGDLLEGWYQDWCIEERERFQFMYLAMLEKLLAYSETHGDYEAGVDYAMRILRHDTARENAHRQLMRLHYLMGDRTQALHQYHTCVAALREELGVEPAHSTQRLYEKIRGDRFDEVALALESSTLALPPTICDPVDDPLVELEHIHQVLDQVQRDVASVIDALKHPTNLSTTT